MLGAHLLAAALGLILLLVTIQLVRQLKLREEYALLWLGTSGLIFLFGIVPNFSRVVASAFGVDYPPALILVLGVLFAIVILLTHSVIITRFADQTRDLAQTLSLLEWRVHELESATVPARPSGDREHVLYRRTNEAGNGASQSTSGASQATSGVSHDGRNDHDGTSADGEAVAATSEAVNPATAPNRRPKVLVIGLDGATFDLIEPWVAAGDLPALGRLIEQGAHGSLRSTTPPMTAPAWASFATGTNPGRHGLYDWVARKRGTYTFAPVTAADCKAPTIYQLLSQVGRRVCAMNVPMTYPATPVNGVMVAGLPAPSTKVPITYPKSFYREMVDAIGGYILYPDPGQAYSEAGVQAFLDRLYKAGELRIKAFEYLRAKERWDFAMLVFNGTDTVSHAMWKYMDRSHPLHDPNAPVHFKTAIRDYYRFVDKYLGDVIDTLDADTTLVLMSDHGFGPFHKFIHVNNWLIEKGHMRVHPNLRSQLKARLFRMGFSPMGVYDTLMRLGLGGLKKEVVRGGNGQDVLKKLFLSFEDIDWSRTRAYSLGNIGQVNLNVVGREPIGCVRPGAEYERVRDEIIADLQQLRDPSTGELVVESIYRREELYQGDEIEKAPDIVFIPRRLEYFGFGEYEFGSHKIVEPMRRGISGTHRMDGIFMAYGRGIRPGACTQGAGLVDLVPTMLALLGEQVPSHLDGRVLDEILSDEPASAVPPSAEPEPSTGRNEIMADLEGHLSEEEAAELSERLRSLGYVG